MIEIKKVGKKFGDKVVFTDLSYTINDGKMIAIVGPSGCGKSTLLNILGLLDTDYSGEVLYDGQLLSKASEKKKDEYIRVAGKTREEIAEFLGIDLLEVQKLIEE